MRQSRQVRPNGKYLRGHVYSASSWRGNPTQRYPGMTEAIRAVKRSYKPVVHVSSHYGDEDWQSLIQQEPG